MTDTSAPEAPLRRALPLWSRLLFALVMAGLTVVFVLLGVWQLNRLGEKRALVALVEERMILAPTPLPPVGEWVGFDPEVYDYRPVRLTGRFVPGQTVLIFTSLSSAQGRYDGAGYWVMTPFLLSGGGTVFVNQGFVPQRLATSFAAGGAVPQGEATLTGIARQSEAVTGFTPPPDAANRIDFIRSVDRLAAMSDATLVPFAPVYVDLLAGSPGALPQGGETVVSFPDNHLGYALTWFGFALITPALLAVWLWRQWRGSSAEAPAV